MATHSSVLAWRIPGTGEPGGLPSMGSHRVDTTEVTYMAQAPENFRKLVNLVCNKFYMKHIFKFVIWFQDLLHTDSGR